MPDETPTTDPKDTFIRIVALLSLVGFGVFIFYLAGMTDSAMEIEWTRLVYLLTGVEAIAFAAAGFLFGKEVHRKQAEQAEKRADEASKTAASAKDEAAEAKTKGRTLAALVRTATEGTGNGGQEESFGPGGSPGARTGLTQLRAVADQLFPE